MVAKDIFAPPGSIPILLLLGGRSKRMGTDKALLDLGGQTLLKRTLEIATNLSDRVYLVTPWRDRYRPYLSAQVQWLDDPWQQGGLMALAHSLKVLAEPNWVLLLACDLPYLDHAQLLKWFACLNAIPDEAQAALVHNGNFYEPCCGFYRGAATKSLARYINDGGRAFQQWLTGIDVCPLAIANSQMLFNCNTPAEFASLRLPIDPKHHAAKRP